MTTEIGMPRVRPPHLTPPTGLTGLTDRHGRAATDLRLSVIDKCNLRCTYCMPAEGMAWLPRNQLMSAEEITRLVRLGHRELGVRELRLTGGEPLARQDLEVIVATIRQECPGLPIALTTNAVGLAHRAHDLRAAGLDRLNVSLDTIHPGTFRELTRRPFLDQVLDGLRAADDAGFELTKINAVLLRGVNDHEAGDLLAWALEHAYQLRFIEHMPLDGERSWTEARVVTADDLRAGLQERFRLVPDDVERGAAPAELYRVYDRALPDGPPLGRVGLISSVTEPFCATCTRTRITAEGRVRSCLFSHEETDLLGLMRSGADDAAVAGSWQRAMWGKPRAHGGDRVGFTSEGFVQPERTMSAIGG